MRLATFICANTQQIIAEWVDFASTLRPFSRATDPETLQDEIVAMLNELAADMETPESPGEAIEKSRGHADATATRPSAAWQHGIERLESGLSIKQVVAEFRALRAVVVRLYQNKHHSDPASSELVRFDEAIDQAISETLDAYTFELDRLRNTLLAVLAHDLRGPLQAILFTGEVMNLKAAREKPDFGPLVDRVTQGASRMRELIDDFLTFITPTLGGEIPLEREDLDMADICRRIIGEVSATLHTHRIHLHTAGNTRGHWDRARLEQVLSNLLRNAAEHGAHDRPITVMVNGDASGVNVSVHNFGEPIPAQATTAIFKPLVQLGNQSGSKREHLGLGLYIAKELVERHGGKIGLDSGALAGTTFHVFLPHSMA